MKFALLVLFAGTTLAAPFWVLDKGLPSATVEELGCETNRFGRSETHTYEYEGESLNAIQGTEKPTTTGLKLTATVVISRLSECKYRMDLMNVNAFTKSMNQDGFKSTSDSTEAKLRGDLERNTVGFSMRGNQIVSVIGSDSDSAQILNIKRGILSTIQLDTVSGEETDIHGKCWTEVTSAEGKLLKRKELSKCSKRAQNEIALQTSSFKTETEMKPLDSTSNCEYTLSGEKIENVVCKETHIFRPFSAGYETPSGAMTTVKQTLRSVRNANRRLVAISTKDFAKASTLLFDHEIEPTVTTNDVKNQFETIMTRLVNPTDKKLSAKQDSAHEFSNLVFLMRKMDSKRMGKTVERYFDCIKSEVCDKKDFALRDLYRQYLLDGVAYCGTPTCISVVRDVILKDAIAGERMNMFLQSIALISKPSEDILHDVLVIAKERPSRQAFLTLGTLMYRICSTSPETCEKRGSIIDDAEMFLKRILRSRCEGQNNHNRVEAILMALKAIGNAQRPFDVQSTLLNCARNSQHANITSSIFDAFRGMPCNKLIKDELFSYLNNVNENDEGRIHAFLTLMKCPTKDVLLRINKTLETEESKHVSSFMWSYLTNILESSDPVHKETKEILETILPLREIDLPFYKFSKSFEKSMHVMGSGASTEGHVIYNKNNVLPKMGMFKVKGHLMGNCIEMLETKIGIDGIESLIDNLAEANGMIPKDVSIDLGKYGKLTGEMIQDWLKKKAGNMKTDDNLTRMHLRGQKKSTPFNAHFSMKVMGQEMRFFSYDDINWMIEQIDRSNVVQLMRDAARGGHKVYSKGLMFLEMSHTVPTGLGLPLKLKLTGSSVTTVEMKGKFDIRNLFWGRPAVDIKGFVKPSAVVELSGQMGIESDFISTGMFVNSSVFTSQLLKGNVLYKHNKMLRINLDTPDEPLQHVNFSSTPFMFMNEKAQVVEGSERKINTGSCYKSKLIGYGLCYNMRVPVAFREYEAPYYPLTGPAYMGFKVVKGDEKLNTFEFLINMEKVDKTTTVGKVLFSSPGAEYERKIDGEIKYTEIENKHSVTFSTNPFGRKGSIGFTYDTETRTTEMTTTNNFFTPKEVMTVMRFFNKTEDGSRKYGFLQTVSYDWYTFKHESNFEIQNKGYRFFTETVYQPEKSVSAFIDYNIPKRKLSGNVNLNGVEQTLEFTNTFTKEGDERGIVLTAQHVQSKKKLEFYGGIVDTNTRKVLVLTVDAFGKKVKNILEVNLDEDVTTVNNDLSLNGKLVRFSGDIKKSKGKRTITMTADIMGKKAVTSVVATNKKEEKSLKLVVETTKKLVDTKMGYYNEEKLQELRFDGDVFGQSFEVFSKVSKLNGYKTTFGGSWNKYFGGIRGNLFLNEEDKKSLCTSFYYGKGNKENEPMNACINLKSMSKSLTHHRLGLTMEMTNSGKNGEIYFDFKKQDGRIDFLNGMQTNGKDVFTNTYSLKYSKDMNNQLRMDLVVGRYKAGYSLVTVSSEKEGKLGFEVYYMDKKAAIVHTLERKASTKTLITQVLVNDEVLPVSTELSLLNGDGVTHPSLKLIVGKYSVLYGVRATYVNVLYQIDSEFAVSKEEQSLFSLLSGTSLSLTKQRKMLKQKYGFSLKGKQYMYGWDLSYENRGTETKSNHALILGLQYATNRKSSVTFLLSNTKRMAAFNVDIEYIPGKQLSHYISFNKLDRQVDLSIEFLPKMYFTVMSKLNNKKGYSLNTNVKLAWKKYERTLNMVNSFVNNNKKVEVSTSFGKDISLTFKYFKKSPKTILVAAELFKKNAKISIIFSSPQISLVLNDKTVFRAFVNYNSKTGNMKFALSDGKKPFFSIKKSFNIFTKMSSIKVFGREEWFSFTFSKKAISLSAFGKKYFGLNNAVKNNKVVIAVNTPFSKTIFKVVVGFNKDEKSVTLGIMYGKNECGIKYRLDWIRLVAGEYLFCNDKTIGAEWYVENGTLNFRIIFPGKKEMIMSAGLKDDRIVTLGLHRVIGGQKIKEASFSYKLSKNMCQFALNWNHENIDNLKKFIAPYVQKIVSKTQKSSEKMFDESTEFAQKTMKELKARVFTAVNNLDKAFDDFDFNKAVENANDLVIAAAKNTRQAIQKTVRMLIKLLKKVKKNIPKASEQLLQLRTKGRKYLTDALETLGKRKANIETILKEVNDVFKKVSSNLTEATKPVIKTAVKLMKEFKFRGKTMVEYAKILKKLINKYMSIIEKESKNKLAELKVLSRNMVQEYKEKLMKMKLPYNDRTVEEMINIIVERILELKRKAMKIDIEKIVKDAKVQALSYKLMGKTLPEHVQYLKTTMPEVTPEKVKESIKDLVKIFKKYRNQLKATMKVINEFTKPLADYFEIVGTAADKHLRPLFIEMMKEIRAQFPEMEIPDIKAYWKNTVLDNTLIMKFASATSKLIKNYKDQVRAIKIRGFTVGTLLDMNIDMIVEMVEKYMKKLNDCVDKCVEKGNKIWKKYSTMNSDQIIEFAFDEAAKKINDVKSHSKKLYNERDIQMKQAKTAVEKAFKQLQKKYNEIKDISWEETYDKTVKMVSEVAAESMEEFIQIIEQIAEMKIWKPSKKALDEMNFALAYFGAHKNFRRHIKALKDVNITKSAAMAVKFIKNYLNELYGEAFLKFIRVVNIVEASIDYIKAIPKKEYKDWEKEVIQYLLTVKEKLVNAGTEYPQQLYRYSMKRANKVIRLARDSYKKINEKYYIPSQRVYKKVSKQSKLFYDDIKKPSVKVFKHYQGITKQFVDEKYELVKKELTKTYNKMMKKMDAKLDEIKTKLLAQYKEFLSTYGDMTWEEVINEINDLVEIQATKAAKYGKKMYKKANKKYEKYLAKATKKYEIAMKKYNKYMKYLLKEVKPKAIELYKKYYNLARTSLENYYKQVNKHFNKVQEKAMKMYDENKHKTLKGIYREIKDMTMKLGKKYYKVAYKHSSAKIELVRTQAAKYYKKATVLLTNVIIPEVKVELESLINQTLKASVVLGKEVVNAYTPQVRLAVQKLKFATLEAFERSVHLAKLSKTELKKKLDKLVYTLEGLKKDIENHEVVVKFLNSKQVKGIKVKIEKWIKLLLKKIEELKKHPELKRWQKKATKLTNDLKEKFSVYKKQLHRYYKKDEIQKVMKVLKQIKESTWFTMNKINKKYVPDMKLMAGNYIKYLTTLPEVMVKEFNEFVKSPEDFFWQQTGEVKRALVNTFQLFSTLDKETCEEYFTITKSFLKIQFHEFTRDCFDKWTKETAKQLKKDTISMTKDLKRDVKKLPNIVKREARKYWKNLYSSVRTWYKDTRSQYFKYWKTCPFRMVVKNTIWSDVIEEIQNHELVALGNDAVEMSKEQMKELHLQGKKQVKVAMKQWGELVKKLQSARKDFSRKMDNIEKTLRTKYEELKQKANNVYDDVDKFLEEKTIHEIVEMTKQRYSKMVEYTVEMKEKAIAMKEKHFAKALKMYNAYKIKLEKMYKKYYGKVYEKTMELKAKHMPTAEKIQAKINKIIEEYREKVLKMWNKHYPYYQMKYQNARESAKDMMETYKAKSIKLAKKTKKYAYKSWMESNVRSSLIKMKKMTIKETIEKMMELPATTKALVILNYNKYYELSSKELQARYNKMVSEYNMRRDQLMKMAEPYITPAVAVFEWTRNEVKETLIFIYKYHHVAERYNKAREFTKSEIRRLTPIVKARMEMMANEAKDMAQYYADVAKISAEEFKNKAIVSTKKAAKRFGKATLKSVHSTMKYIDNFDMDKVTRKAKSIYSTFNKYVTIDAKRGEILISIPHRDVVPSFSHHFNKAGKQIKRTVRMVQNRGKEIMDDIQTRLNDIQKRVEELKEKVKRQVMANTKEIRFDLKISYKVNRAVFDRLYSKARVSYKKYLERANMKYRQMKKQMDKYYKMFVEMKSKAFVAANRVFTDLYETRMTELPRKVAGYSKKWYRIAKNKATKMYTTYKPIVKKYIRKTTIEVQQTIKKYNKKMSPYKYMFTDAYKKYQSGKPLRKIANEIYEQVSFVAGIQQRKFMRMLETERRRLCRSDPKLCKYVRNSLKTHSFFMNKYMKKGSKIVGKYLEDFTAFQVKTIRFARRMMYKCWYYNKPMYRDTAMVFGNNHVMTFDKMLYNLPNFVSNKCEHVLLNDFYNKEISVVKGRNFIEVTTPKQTVKLFNNGKAVTKLSDKTVLKGLPVETESFRCKRIFDYVKCEFNEQKLKVKMDLKNDIITFSVSGWHHGKLQGLLGTNNLEKYDDMTRPNGKIASSTQNFIDSYEMSGSAKCKAKENAKACVDQVMPKCEKFFENRNSPYAKYFDVLETKAFMTACLQDYRSCDNKKTKEPKFCSAVAAFVAYAKSNGYRISKPEECLKYKSRDVGSEWKQRVFPKQVDVVVMVSQRKSMENIKSPIAKSLRLVQKSFKKTGMDARYALIGFGGKMMHQKPSVHALSHQGDIFGNFGELERAISHMTFENSEDNSNDAYQAISFAAYQTFRPEANRVFILFNTEPHTPCTYGPSHLETVYALTKEADASLFVFDNFHFKKFPRQGRTYGQTANLVFTTKNPNGMEAGRIELPSGPMTELVEKSNGGMFSNKIVRPKETSNMLYKAIRQSLTMDRRSCRQCTVVKMWYGQSRPVCKPLPRNEC